MGISQEFINALGWAMIHSIWQGLLIFMVIRLLFFIGEEYLSSSSKAFILLSGLTVSLGWLLKTYYDLVPEGASQLVTSTTTPALSLILESYQNTTQANPWDQIVSIISVSAQYIPYLWFVGVFFYILKTISSIRWVNSIKKNSISVPANIETAALKVQKVLNIKKLNVRLSDKVHVPMVVGFFKQVVLFPVSMQTGFNNQQIESIIAHEAGHIIRKDGLINLYVAFIESILFYNPVFWLLKKDLQVEREKCCDEIAIRVTHDRKEYVNTLLSLAQLNLSMQYYPGNTFWNLNKNELIKRVKFVMEGKSGNSYKENRGSVIMAFVFMLAATLYYVDSFTKPNSTPNHKIVAASVAPKLLTEANSIAEESTVLETSHVLSSNTQVKNVEESKPNQDSKHYHSESSARARIQTKSKPLFIAKLSSDNEHTIKLKLSDNNVSPTVSFAYSLENGSLLELNSMLADTIPDLESWEEFEENMKKLEVNMQQMFKEHELQMKEFEVQMENFNDEIGERMNDFEFEFDFDPDMDFDTDLDIDGELSVHMEEMQERLEEIENMKFELHEEMIEKMEEQMKLKEEYMREFEEERWEEMENRWKEEESKWKEEENRFKKFENDLREQLVKDGFIDSKNDPVQFKYDESSININGEKLDKKKEKVYRDLMKDHGMSGRGSIMWN